MSFFKKLTVAAFGAKKSDMPEGQWHKCPSCKAMLHEIDLVENLRTCPKCGHHNPMDSDTRIASIIDGGTWQPMDENLRSLNPLEFKGYTEKVAASIKKTEMNEAVVTGRGKLHGHPVALAVMDFRFQGASMGSVVGEKITRAIETATREKRGLIIVAASGGARMHEGILSLMQMAKVSAALARYGAAGGFYICVLTHPTMGGVAASWAFQGDVTLAEPKAMIGFAGARTIKNTIRLELPDGFQTSEFLLQHGFVDRIVHRHDLRTEVSRLIDYCDMG